MISLRKIHSIFLFVIVITNLFAPIQTTALLPTFLYYQIDQSNFTPDVSQEVSITMELDFITDLDEDISALVGTLSILLHWSRDRSSWVTESMTLIAGNNIYRKSIPRQDGYTNQRYDFGAGQLYWYIEIKNELQESDTLFSAGNPNTEIFYLDANEGITTVVVGTQPVPNPIGQAFNNLLSAVFGVENPLEDPYMQFLLFVMGATVIIIIVVAVAGRGGGSSLQNSLGKLFRKR